MIRRLNQATFAFHSKLDSYGSEPKVLVFTSINPQLVGDKGWCYIGCSKCSTKLQREISSFPCLFCDKTNDVAAALMYHVELSVSDLKDDAVFVAFDMEIVTLTSIQASEAAQILLKLGKFNFTSRHQTFTIPRIITEKQRPPLTDFFIHGDGQEPNDDVPVEKPVASNGFCWFC
ncbi:hypothetical protein F2Q68_00016744 [Brassica cretica]|uniref:Replication factor A C-terminal domain-containing protein n=1 Tax=Brassica cretica TaxID=69181 RepID=A0A8S9HLV7_BRACR|nr:hypothetical protein F2Q68_00016744 [Brassica cretica]